MSLRAPFLTPMRSEATGEDREEGVTVGDTAGEAH